MTEQMHLAVEFSFSHMEGRWRLPGAWVGRTFPDIEMFKELAIVSERGCFDMIFFGDNNGIPSTYGDSLEAAVRWGTGWPRQDMTPYIGALSQVTNHIGFGLTYSSTFMHPYYVARLLNSIDHVTNGRAAFNVVTSSNTASAANFGFDELMDHDERYERMEEFVDVCTALWDSVEPDAMRWDRTSGMLADPSKVHAINHDGKWFKVKGPLNSVPSPQQRPVLIQAGGSPRGMQASARFADIVFAVGDQLPLQVAHRAALDRAVVAAGRDPADVGILWLTQVVVGESEREAKDHLARLFGLLPAEGVGALLSASTGIDFSRVPKRFSLEDLAAQILKNNASPRGAIYELMQERGTDYELTREEFFDAAWRKVMGYDHTLVGDATQVADRMEEIFEATGERGGFMIAHPQVTPRDLVDVVGLLLPELRRRGRFRERYEGSTLRENLGIAPVG